MPIRARDADPLRILKDLVAIPSVNLNREQADRDKPELKMSEYLDAYLKKLGFTVRKQRVRTGRFNLIATLKGRDPRKKLMLEAHMDTVGTEGMTVTPFRITRKGNRLYGRGTADTKGPMASYLTGIARALRDGVRPAWSILFVATMGEETGCEGAAALSRSGFKASAGLVAEPTRLGLCVAHKGAIWSKVRIEGRTAHGSSPQLGVSAIEGAAVALQTMMKGSRNLPRKRRHPLLTAPTISVGRIWGGEKDNVVPASAEFTIDSRVHPGEHAGAYIKRLERLLRSARLSSGKQVDARVDSYTQYPGFCSDPRNPFLRTFSQIARKTAGNSSGKPIGVSYFSDAGPLASCVPQLAVFGPGDIAQAHTPDEFIELTQLEAGTEIVRRLIAML